MLQGEHSAILSTFIKLPFVIKIFALSIFEWPLKTIVTVHHLSGYPQSAGRSLANLCDHAAESVFYGNYCENLSLWTNSHYEPIEIF